MGVGDEILAAGQAERQFRETGFHAIIVDAHNRPRWHPIWEGNPIIVNALNGTPNHNWARAIRNGPNCRPYIVYPFTAETGWTFNTAFRAREHVAKIYLTDEELAFGQAALERYGPFVLIEPWSKHENLRWPMAKWERLVKACEDLTFVQHVSPGAPLVPGAQHIQTTFRQACALVVYARIYIRGESGMLHAAAALGAQTIALWGGCMDWDVLGGYPGQRGVGISRPFCGSFKPCAHCAACMARISVDEVVATMAGMGVE